MAENTIDDKIVVALKSKIELSAKTLVIISKMVDLTFLAILLYLICVKTYQHIHSNQALRA